MTTEPWSAESNLIEPGEDAMTTTTDARSDQRAQPHWLLKPPAVGIFAFLTILAWKPLAHTLMVFAQTFLGKPQQYIAGFLIGSAGFAMLWKGLKTDEFKATWLGFFAGALIWFGWFEFSFHLIADLLNVGPLMVNGRHVYSGYILVLQASGIFMFTILLFLASNKDSGCRMFLWFHRRLGTTPGPSTPGYQRQFARIAALELIFTNWFCYIYILVIVDPRIGGLRSGLAYAATALFAGIAVYLIGWKLREQRRPGHSVRYAIGAVAVTWVCFEMAQLWKWYREPWIHPFEYPITNILITLAFVGMVVSMFVLARDKQTPAVGKVSSDKVLSS